MKDQVVELIGGAVSQLLTDGVLTEGDIPTPQVDHTRDPSHGDLATNIAMVLAKRAGMAPRDLAAAIVERIPTNTVISRCDIAGPGFINFHISQASNIQIVEKILESGAHFGRTDDGAGKRVQVEFVSANPTGPLHVGHGRGAAIGDALCRLLDNAGWSVHSEFYYNDAGQQISNLALSVKARLDEIEPTDPVTENMKILQQEGVKAFAYQDHEAHIQVHMAMLNDPKIKELVGQSPFAPVIQKAMIEHITEHVAFQYRKEIEEQLGVPLPDPDEPLPEDVEFSMSSTVAKAAEKLLQQDKAEMAQLQAQRQQQDPLTQIQQRELALKEAEFQHKRELDFAKLQLDSQSKTANIMTDQERIASQERQEGARLGVKIATEKDRIERKDQLEGAKLGVEIAKSIAQNTKEQ